MYEVLNTSTWLAILFSLVNPKHIVFSGSRMAVHHGGLLLLILSLLSTSCYVEGWGNCAFTRDQFRRMCCIKTTQYCTCNYEITEMRKCLDRERRKPPCQVYNPPNETVGCCKKRDLSGCLCTADKICPKKRERVDVSRIARWLQNGRQV